MSSLDNIAVIRVYMKFLSAHITQYQKAAEPLMVSLAHAVFAYSFEALKHYNDLQ